MAYRPVILEKEPVEVIDYSISFSAFLNTASDTIQSHTATLGDGITIDSSTATDTEVRIWVSGGQSGSSYEGSVSVVTAGGRTLNQDIIFIIRD